MRREYKAGSKEAAPFEAIQKANLEMKTKISKAKKTSASSRLAESKAVIDEGAKS